MPRPFPVWPRGPRRRRVVRESILFGCPRVAPDWELGALRALMKPQMRGAIAHRKAMQVWSRDGVTMLEAARDAVATRIGFTPELRFAADGDYFVVADVDGAACEEAKGFALLVSRRLP